MEYKKASQGGFVRIIAFAVVIIALLAYYKIDVRALADKPIVAKFLNIFVVAWGTYVKPLLVYLVKSIVGLFS